MPADKTMAEDIEKAIDQVQQEEVVDEVEEKLDEILAEKGEEDKGEEVKKEDDSGDDKEAKAATEDDEEDKEDDKEEKAVEPPSNWSAADKKVFKSLQPEAQKFLVDRHKAMEADYTKKTQDLQKTPEAELRKKLDPLEREYGPIEQMFAPHREVMRQKGLTPQSIIQGWAEVERRLMEGDGIEVIKGLVNGYQLDQGEVLKALGAKINEKGEIEVDEVDRRVKAAMKPFESYMTTEQQRQQAAQAESIRAQAARLETEINAFKAEADKDGNLKHPHFDAVQEDMVNIATGYKARGLVVPKLEDLYNRAVRANPSTYEAYRTQEIESAKAKEKAEARAKAAKAANANKVVSGSPGVGQSSRKKPVQNMTLAEQLEDAYVEVTGASS